MIALGGPVQGKEFYDRVKVIKTLRKGIPSAHHALVGPRRIGKTSILRELGRLGVKGFIPVEVNIAKVVPMEPKYVLRELGRKTLEAVIKEEGLLSRMPEFVKAKISQISDFVRDNLRVKISDWLTLYFDEGADLTPLIEETFSTIEAFGRKLLIMMDEITSVIRLRGAAPGPRSMELMWAFGNYISEARNTRYIISGSQPGLMELLLTKETAPFLGRFVMIEIGGLEEEGAEEMIRDKIKRKIPENYIAQLKQRTRLWPLYLQAYCLATEHHSGKVRSLRDVDEDVFGALHGHFLYLEGLLTDDELRALLGMAKWRTGSVKELSPKIGIKYGSLETALRRLELKGFVRKIAPAIYEPLDPIFQEWLMRTRA
jgi:AAA+ ATPase superfamily predicted ATPase